MKQFVRLVNMQPFFYWDLLKANTVCCSANTVNIAVLKHILIWWFSLQLTKGNPLLPSKAHDLFFTFWDKVHIGLFHHITPLHFPHCNCLSTRLLGRCTQCRDAIGRQCLGNNNIELMMLFYWYQQQVFSMPQSLNS